MLTCHPNPIVLSRWGPYINRRRRLHLRGHPTKVISWGSDRPAYWSSRLSYGFHNYGGPAYPWSSRLSYGSWGSLVRHSGRRDCRMGNMGIRIHIGHRDCRNVIPSAGISGPKISISGHRDYRLNRWVTSVISPHIP